MALWISGRTRQTESQEGWLTMRIEYLYRFPVKGLTAEALEMAEVEKGGAIPWDRAFALAQGDSGFDPANPEWRHKQHFLCLMKNASASQLFSFFDPQSGTLTIRAPDGSAVMENALTEAGRERIGSFLTAYLGAEARGTPRFHHVPGFVFGDQRSPVVSLINLASLRVARNQDRRALQFMRRSLIEAVACLAPSIAPTLFAPAPTHRVRAITLSSD